MINLSNLGFSQRSGLKRQIQINVTVTVTVTLNKLPISQNILVEIKNGFMHWNQHKILSNMDL